MREKISELADKWNIRANVYSADGDLHFAYARCANELVEIIHADADAPRVVTDEDVDCAIWAFADASPCVPIIDERNRRCMRAALEAYERSKK